MGTSILDHVIQRPAGGDKVNGSGWEEVGVGIEVDSCGSRESQWGLKDWLGIMWQQIWVEYLQAEPCWTFGPGSD